MVSSSLGRNKFCDADFLGGLLYRYPYRGGLFVFFALLGMSLGLDGATCLDRTHAKEVCISGSAVLVGLLYQTVSLEKCVKRLRVSL